MGSLFSSPGKQASQAAQASGQMSQQEIQQLEGYISGQQGQLRGAIAGMGPNPYIAAGDQMSTKGYGVNPNDRTQFGSSGPGTTGVGSNVTPPAPQYTPPNTPAAGPAAGGGGQTRVPLPVEPTRPPGTQARVELPPSSGRNWQL